MTLLSLGLWLVCGFAAAVFAAAPIRERWSTFCAGSGRGQGTVTTRLKVAVFALLAAACASDGPRQISNSGRGAFEASLAVSDDGFVAAWYDVRDGNPEIYVRLLSRDGRPAQRERRLTDDTEQSYEADVKVVGMNIAVAWYDKGADGRLQARLGLWNRDGTLMWLRTLSASETNGRNPVLAVRGTELFVAWIEDSGSDASEVLAGWWNLAGQRVGDPLRLGPASRMTWNLNADIDQAGRGWVAFDARASTRSDELFLAIVDGGNVQLRQLTEDDGVSSKYPDIALSDSSAAMTWYDERDGNEEVYLSILQIAQLAQATQATPIDTLARRVTNTPGHSIGSYVAWNGDTAGLAWCDDSAGSQHEIFFQPFGRNGAPLADARRVTNNATSSLMPSIQPSGRGFALLWTEYSPAVRDVHDSTERSEIAFTVVE